MIPSANAHCRLYSKDERSLRDAEDIPIKYSESKANVYDSVTSFSSKKRKKLWTAPSYQRPVLQVTFLVLVAYLCFIRETNDWDENFERKVYDSFPDMEEYDLNQKIKKRKKKGQDCTLELYQLRELLRYRY